MTDVTEMEESGTKTNDSVPQQNSVKSRGQNYYAQTIIKIRNIPGE